jgi:hypothetical protein
MAIGDNIIGSSVTKRIAEALTLASSENITFTPTYGDEILPEDIDDDKLRKDTDTIAFIMSPIIDPEDPLMLDTGGELITGDLQLWLFAKNGVRAIEAICKLFEDFGWITEFGKLGVPPKAPWQIGNLTVWRFNPIGGLNTISQKWGNYYLNRQVVDFALK